MSSFCRFLGYFNMCLILSIFCFLALTCIVYNANLPNFQVNSASFNSTRLNMTLSVSNSNRVSSYGPLYVHVFYTDEDSDSSFILYSSTVASFNGSMIEMKLQLNTRMYSAVANNIDLSRRKHGMVELWLSASSSIRFKSNLLFLYRKGNFDVDCYPLKFVISPNAYNTTLWTGILLHPLSCTTA